MYTAVKPSGTCQDVCMSVCSSEDLLVQPVLPSTKPQECDISQVSTLFAIRLCTGSGLGDVSHLPADEEIILWFWMSFKLLQVYSSYSRGFHSGPSGFLPDIFLPFTLRVLQASEDTVIHFKAVFTSFSFCLFFSWYNHVKLNINSLPLGWKKQRHTIQSVQMYPVYRC